MGAFDRLSATACVLALLLLTACKKAEGEACSKGQCEGRLACVGIEEPHQRHRAGKEEPPDPKLQRKPQPGEQTCQKCRETESCTDNGWCYCPESYEGCPCGCDRSEKMSAELRAQGGAEALETLGWSLQTIAEREQAGYITEAMVQHRLRLLGLQSELGPTQAASTFGLTPELSPIAERLRSSRGELPATDDGTLRVRSRLLVHGEAIEMVRGRKKKLLPSFRLWLGLENLTRGPLTVRRPTVEATPTLPVSRWYVEDTAGEPWNGQMQPDETESVLVVGYLGAPVKPGTRIDAVVHVGEMRIETTAVAGKRWNELFL